VRRSSSRRRRRRRETREKQMDCTQRKGNGVKLTAQQ